MARRRQPALSAAEDRHARDLYRAGTTGVDGFALRPDKLRRFASALANRTGVRRPPLIVLAHMFGHRKAGTWVTLLK